MSLSDDQIRRLARLARIALRPDETRAVGESLDRILALVDEEDRVRLPAAIEQLSIDDDGSVLGSITIAGATVPLRASIAGDRLLGRFEVRGRVYPAQFIQGQ